MTHLVCIEPQDRSSGKLIFGSVFHWVRFLSGFAYGAQKCPVLGTGLRGPKILQSAPSEKRNFVDLRRARSALRWTAQGVDDQHSELCYALMGEIFANELWHNPFIDKGSYYRITLSGIVRLDL